MIKPRSKKRSKQEAEYRKLIRDIDREAHETKQLGCFFCGVDVEDADHHHLDGRNGDLLLKREWIVRVHHKCHMDYHDKPVAKLYWFDGYLSRLKRINETKWQKEIWKKNK